MISGFVGLVLVPDAETMTAARDLAAEVVREGAESVLAGPSLPHLTLTQCPLRDAPPSRIAELIDRVGARLHDVAIPLETLVVFGGGFVFWCVEPRSSARARLQLAHEEALTLADGLLDPETNVAVVAATARLTGDDPVLIERARRHGYAFVGDRYMPHVTLGFDSRLAKHGASLMERVRSHTMRVERVALARFGPYGVVHSLISLADA